MAIKRAWLFDMMKADIILIRLVDVELNYTRIISIVKSYFLRLPKSINALPTLSGVIVSPVGLCQ